MRRQYHKKEAVFRNPLSEGEKAHIKGPCPCRPVRSAGTGGQSPRLSIPAHIPVRAEISGYRDPIHKISVGYRLLERYWGKGIAGEALEMMIDYLYKETDIEIITASTMIENQASANVLRKNGFQLVVHAVDEDWGYDKPTVTDKWIR